MSEPIYVKLGSMLKRDLALFAERVFRQLNPGTPYVHSWHIELIADALRRVEEGACKRLIINVPPRSMKSTLVSVAWPAFLLGRRQGTRIICASYAQELADKHAGDCRSVMLSGWYQKLFGAVLLHSKAAVANLRTAGGGSRLATSVGGTLTGLGGNIIIIDDPLKPDQALSTATRNTANEWVANTVMSRLDDKRTGSIVVIMQRLHMDDVVGHLVGKEQGWEVLALPAIAEQEMTYRYRTWRGPQTTVLHVDDLLQPVREPMQVLEQLRGQLGEYNFAAQYQQSPVPLGGGMVKLDWLQYYEPEELPQTFEQVVQSWDTASKPGELSDFSVCTTFGVKGKHWYLLDVRRARMDFPDLKRAVLEQIELYKPQIVLVEEQASGIQLIQDLRALGINCLRAIRPQGSKELRMHAQTAKFEGGTVRLPRQKPWLTVYVSELTSFPKGKYDDQVDSTSQALKWMGEYAAQPTMLRYVKQECKRQRCEPYPGYSDN